MVRGSNVESASEGVGWGGGGGGWGGRLCGKGGERGKAEAAEGEEKRHGEEMGGGGRKGEGELTPFDQSVGGGGGGGGPRRY